MSSAQTKIVLPHLPAELWRIIFTMKKKLDMQQEHKKMLEMQQEHKKQFHNTVHLIKHCGYYNGWHSIYDYTAYGWGCCERTCDESWLVDCPDPSFVSPDYENSELVVFMNS